MPNKGDNRDREIARIAASQHGAVAAKQLADLGLGRAAISERAASGRLHLVHRGVYAVGHPGLSRHGRWMAAVLAVGPGGVLSHCSAAVLWGLLRPIAGPIHVSVPGTAGRKQRRGVRVHRCRALQAEALSPLHGISEQKRQSPLVTVRDGIPVTIVQRTVDDLRGAVPPHLVRRARRQAELAGYRLEGEVMGTRSDLEDRFLWICRRHGLPMPEVNVRIGRWTVDFAWEEERLVVEADGYAYHRGRIAFEDDRTRDLELRGLGYRALRFSDAQLNAEPGRVAADVAATLFSASRSPRGAEAKGASANPR
jgi:very-short-patch-repair endonuclease